MALSSDKLRQLDHDGLTDLLTHWEDVLSDTQKDTVIAIIEEMGTESDDDDDDEGFVLDPRPSTPKNINKHSLQRRSSLNDSVWTATKSSSMDERASVCSSEAANPLDESPTVSTTITESLRYAESDTSEATVNPLEGDPESKHRRACEFSNAPRRSEASVDNLDHECQAKRRAKAADDAAEFARALRWVVSVLAIDTPVDIETRPEECFGEHLKDGVLLCKLLNKIKPGTVTKISNHSSLTFHQMSNITSFLRGCQTLGVHKRDCFDTVDLQQLRDLSKVYETLLMLSATAEKKITTFSGPFLYSAKREERRRRRSVPLVCTPAEEPAPSLPVSPIPSAQVAPVPHQTSFSTISELVKHLGLDKYSSQLAEVAGDISDLAEMTDEDFEQFLETTKMPALKARRFKKALIDLGAKLVA